MANVNSGGDLLYVSPGLRLGLRQKWSVFAQLGIPILDEPRGIQHGNLRAIIGVGVAF